MSFSRKSLYEFINAGISYQKTAAFEFRYPALFDDDSFLIEQLDFPQLESNMGYVWLNGFQIPVHSTAKFGNNELRFTMYVEEFFLTGKYATVFKTILTDEHDIRKFSNRGGGAGGDDILAYIIPLSLEAKAKNDSKALVLHNALLKNIGMSGGFTANSTTLAKFDVTLTYSYFDDK